MSENPEQKKKKSHSSKLLVPLIVLLGIVVGILTYLAVANTIPEFRGFPRFGGPFGPRLFLEYHIILSTVSIFLLLALIVVYSRSYLRTKANFVLGLIVVLLSLLLQNLLSYPLLHEFIDRTPLATIGSSSPVADVFAIIAYAVFLYLTLE
ncbi:MAG: hypothetical protein JRN20_15000 [Nitrososphaerota archaeon]|nr:hypothetical protein [Nitrososphaerota archaeon]